MAHPPFSPDTLKKCIEVYACQTIGDEQTYIRNLRKQALAKNSAAIDLLDNIQTLQNIQAYILNMIEDLRTFGLSNLSALLQNLRQLPVPDFKESETWNLCNITGTMCSHAINFHYNHEQFYVQKSFRLFLCAFWFSFNVSLVEQTRVQRYMATQSDTAVSIGKRINTFFETNVDENNRIANIYYNCLRYTIGSLEKTIARHHMMIKPTKSTVSTVSGPLSLCGKRRAEGPPEVPQSP
jgi:hypothetical protein